MKRFRSSWFVAAAIVAGCGGSTPSTSNTGTVGPHRGVLLKLPDDLGFAEVVVESTGNPARSLTTEVAAYFFGPDAKAAIMPPPTDVSFLLYLAEAKARQKVAMKPALKSSDPAGTGRFVAEPPPGFDGVVTGGTLAARLGGREVVVSF